MSRKLLLTALLLAAVLVVSLYRAKHGAAEAERALAAVEAAIDTERRRAAELRAEYDALTGLAAIDEAAAREMGLRPVRPEQIVLETELLERLGGPVAVDADGDAETDAVATAATGGPLAAEARP